MWTTLERGSNILAEGFDPRRLWPVGSAFARPALQQTGRCRQPHGHKQSTVCCAPFPHDWILLRGAQDHVLEGDHFISGALFNNLPAWHNLIELY